MTLKDLNQEKDEESLKKHTDEMELNEKHLSLIYDTLSDAIFLLAIEPDDCFHFVSVNQAFLAAIGITREQVVGIKIEQVLPKTAHALVISKYKEAINENKTVFWEQVFAYPTGERVSAVAVTPVRTAEGVCTHLVGSVHDLTETKQAEEALRESEENLRAILDASPDVIHLLDINGIILSSNKGFAKRMGLEIDDVMGKCVFDYTPTESVHNRKAAIDKVFRTGEPLKLEDRGLTGIFESHIHPVFNPVGEVTAVAVYARDITEHKQAEEALHESEERLSSFMNSASDSFYLLDADLNFVEINGRGLAIIGKNKEDVIGKNIAEIVPYVKESGRYEKHLEVIRTGQPFVIDHFIPHPVFGDLSFMLKAFKVGDGLGVIATDITERKQAEEELQKRIKELETFYRTTLGREERVIELKQEVNELLEQLGKNKKYRDYS